MQHERAMPVHDKKHCCKKLNLKNNIRISSIIITDIEIIICAISL